MYLVGFESQTINNNSLPTIHEVLSFFFFYKHCTKKLSIHKSATEVAKIVIKIWNKFMIPTNFERNIIPKIKNLYQIWQKTMKHKKYKKSLAQKSQEENFKRLLNNLFDISRSDSFKFLSPEFIEFYN